MCIKDTNIPLKDGRKILFFNTKGKNINVSKQIKEFLDYLETKNVASSFTKQLDIAVEKARQNKEWRIEYMKNWIHDIDMQEEGKKRQIISLVVKKIKKDKTLEEIATELEEDVTNIQKYYNAALQCSPDYNEEEIYIKAMF